MLTTQYSLSQIGAVLFCLLLLLFFGYHTIAGERGLMARDNIDRAIEAAHEDLSLIERENAFLAQRIILLKNGAIDGDMLAETARAELGLYSNRDVIIAIDEDF